MRTQIENYVKLCLLCGLHDHNTKKRCGGLEPINPYKSFENIRPGYFLSADLLGRFPKSEKRNKYIIVVTCIFTRYEICGARFLVNNVICEYGALMRILTDNRKCFQAKIDKEMAKALGFKQNFTI